MLAMARVWTPDMDERLKEMWGNVPRSEIADGLGVTTDSVRSRERRLGLKSPMTRDDFISGQDLQELLGLLRESAYELRDRLPSRLMYVGDSECEYVLRYQLMAWLCDPLNVYGLSPQRITDEAIASRARETLEEWDDEWVDVATAGEMLAESMDPSPQAPVRNIYRWINKGKLPSVAFRKRWVRRSYVEAAIEMTDDDGALHDEVPLGPRETYEVCPYCFIRFERVDLHTKACKKIPIDVARVFRQEEGQNITSLSRRYGVTDWVLRRALRRYGITDEEVAERKRVIQSRLMKDRTDDRVLPPGRSLYQLFDWDQCAECQILIFDSEEDLEEAQEHIAIDLKPEWHVSPNGRLCALCANGR